MYVGRNPARISGCWFKSAKTNLKFPAKDGKTHRISAKSKTNIFFISELSKKERMRAISVPELWKKFFKLNGSVFKKHLSLQVPLVHLVYEFPAPAARRHYPSHMRERHHLDYS